MLQSFCVSGKYVREQDQRSGGNPKAARWSGQLKGMPFMTRSSSRSAGCRPSRIAMVMSGAEKARPRIRLTYRSAKPSCAAIARIEALSPEIRSSFQVWARVTALMSAALGRGFRSTLPPPQAPPTMRGRARGQADPHVDTHARSISHGSPVKSLCWEMAYKFDRYESA